MGGFRLNDRAATASEISEVSNPNKNGEKAMVGKMMASVLVALVVSGLSFGATQFQDQHPRRAEVNKRLNRQNHRIDEGVATGKLTPAQGRQLHAENHALRKQERVMAAEHGGHITKGEQRQLNREENQVSRQISQEKHL